MVTSPFRVRVRGPRRLDLLVILFIAAAAGPTASLADPAGDEAAARALFERNLAAIEDRDAPAYLACYLNSDKLVRNGFDGPELGYDSLAASMGEDTWPDFFEAEELQVHHIAPGVVYGHYRYHVRFGDVESRGVSERIFLRTDRGWRIAVTTAFDAPPTWHSESADDDSGEN